MDERQRILQLRKELHDHNYKYYVLNQPEITDQQFDFMMHELQDLEARHPERSEWVATSDMISSRWLTSIRCSHLPIHTMNRMWQSGTTV